MSIRPMVNASNSPDLLIDLLIGLSIDLRELNGNL